MIFRLVILNGERHGERITVAPDPMRIGRDPSCEIRFDDSEIASLHAEITHTDEGLFIRDLGSMNRVLVNNHETREARLKHGDVVEVGRTRFLVQAYVQAEVLGENQAAKRRLWKRILGVTIALVVLAVIARRCQQLTPSEAPVRAPARIKYAPPRTTTNTVPRPSKTPGQPPSVTPATSNASPSASSNQQTITSITSAIPPSLVAAPLVEPDPGPVIKPSLASTSDLAAAEAIMATSRTNSATTEMDRARKEIESAANELLQSRVRDLMSEAASNSSPEEVDQVLAGIQRVNPDFADAYLERARLQAERGRLDPAMAQLSELVRRAPDAPAAEKARTELMKLASAREHFVFPFAGQVKIASAELNKFPETAGQQELRILSIGLDPAGQEHSIDASAVRVEVRFYDRDPATGLIHPTTASITPPPPLQGLWPEGTRKALTASYGVPAGTPRTKQFYGCLVRVHYYGALQDEWMQPKDLPADVQMAPPEARSR
jgi:hypothetical protein